MSLYRSMTELVGGTPLLMLEGIGRKLGLKAEVAAKIEFYNPTGSVKDRAALQMIRDAEEKGLISPGATIIEPTSGNTGIGLAAIGAARGYHVILTMPETMSVERRSLLKAYGAEIVLTEGKLGMKGAISKAEELSKKRENSIVLGQFSNRANPAAHYQTTGPEIWKDTDGRVDLLVAGVGTGGTISGTGKYLREQKAGIEIVAVEPDKSPVMSGGSPSPHGLQGIGAGFIPDALDTGIYDRIARVQEEEAYQAARMLAADEGILVGVSSGAALHAAIEEAKRPENAGKLIVVVLPDTGERYLSTPLFQL